VAHFSGDGVTESSDSAIFSGTASSLHMIAREGTQAPGAEPGGVFGDFVGLPPPFTPSGQIAFSNALTGATISPSNDEAYFITDTNAVPYLIAREGSDIEFGAGQSKRIVYLDESGIRDTTFNSQGQLFFRAVFPDGEGLFLSSLELGTEQTATSSSGPFVPEPAAFQLITVAIGI
jgi:hypothetical protein